MARGGGLGARVGHAEGGGLGSRVGSPLIMIHSRRSPSACGIGTSMSPQNRKDRGAGLQGAAVRSEGAAQCAEARSRLVLLAAPGVGKGTPGDLLTHRLGLFIFSTSDIFRAAVRRAEWEPTSLIRQTLGVNASWCSSPGFHGLGDGAGQIRLRRSARLIRILVCWLRWRPIGISRRDFPGSAFGAEDPDIRYNPVR